MFTYSLLMAMASSTTGVVPGYVVNYGCRFNDDDSDFLSRTFSTGSTTTWTMSLWIKLANVGLDACIISSDTDGNSDWIQLQTDGTLRIVRSGANILLSNQLWRDPLGWGHLVIASNLSESTASDKLKVYWNGTEITSWDEDNRSGKTSWSFLNAAKEHNIGRRLAQAHRY